MRLRKLLKFVGSAIIMLFLLNSCEMLGLDPNGNGDGNGDGPEATNQQAAEYTQLVLGSVGLLFNEFTGEETDIYIESEDGSVVIDGDFTPQSGAISFTVTLNNFTDGTSNVRVATLAGNPISVTGIVGEDAGLLTIIGAANLINTDFATITLNVTVEWQNSDPEIKGDVLIDSKSFDAASLGIELGDGGDGGGGPADEEVAQYTGMLLQTVGVLFDNFNGEETIYLENDDGSVIIDGTFTPQTGSISFNVTLNDYSDGMSNVSASTFSGTPIAVNGIIGEDAGSLNINGSAQLFNTDYSVITLNLTVSWQTEDPVVTGTIMVDDESFDASDLDIPLGDGGSGEYYTIDDIAGVWQLGSISEFDPDDGEWYTDYFPMDLAYEMTYDNDNDIEGDSDFDGDGFPDTYNMKQYIEISNFEEMRIYLAMEFENTNNSVTLEDIQNMDYPVVATGLYTINGYVDSISVGEDGMTLFSSNYHIDGLEVELVDNGNTMIISGMGIEVTLTRESANVLDGAIELTDMDAEYDTILMFIEGGDEGGPIELSMMLLQPMGSLMMDFSNLGENEAFTYEHLTGTTGTGGTYTATISYDNYLIDEEEGVTIDGDISVTGDMNDPISADYDGTITLTNAPVMSITINYSATMVSETEVSITGSITIDGEEFTFDNEYFDVGQFDEHHGMPYPMDGTAEDLAAYYPLASVADIGMVFESAAMGMDPYADGSITGEGWMIEGTYTDAQNYTYTITLTDFYPDHNYLVMLSGETTGVAALDVNGDGTATLVSTGDVTIAGDDTMNSTVSFDLTLGIMEWSPDGTITGSVTLDGTTYDAAVDLTFDFGMEE